MQFTSVANVIFPELYQDLIRGLNVFNFDLSWMLSAGCLVDFDFHDRLLVSTIGLVLAMLFLVATYAIATHLHRGATEALRNVRHKHASTALFLAFVMYSSVSSVLFSMFACEDLDDGKKYLRADYRIECNSSKHKYLQVYAGFMLFFFTLGIPAVYAGLLFRDRDLLVRSVDDRERRTRVEYISGLWKPYRPSVFYYEVVECGRRILLAGVVVFIYPNTAAQIAVALFMAFAFSLLSEALTPYASKWDVWLNRTGHLIVFASMYVALLLKVDISGERGSSQTVFETVLVAAHACMVVAIVLESVVLAWSLRGGGQKEDPLPRSRSSKVIGTSGNIAVGPVCDTPEADACPAY